MYTEIKQNQTVRYIRDGIEYSGVLLETYNYKDDFVYCLRPIDDSDPTIVYKHNIPFVYVLGKNVIEEI